MKSTVSQETPIAQQQACPKAKFIAIGLVPSGYISIGVVPMGVLAIGVVPMGVISIGVVSMGTIAAGLVSMGLLGVGLHAHGLKTLSPEAVQPVPAQVMPQKDDHSHHSH